MDGWDPRWIMCPEVTFPIGGPLEYPNPDLISFYLAQPIQLISNRILDNGKRKEENHVPWNVRGSEVPPKILGPPKGSGPPNANVYAGPGIMFASRKKTTREQESYLHAQES